MLLGRVKYSFKDQKSVSFQLGCDEGWVTVTNATIRIPQDQKTQSNSKYRFSHDIRYAGFPITAP
jgi:hypothetical protein